jgi:hypothetical protein
MCIGRRRVAVIAATLTTAEQLRLRRAALLVITATGKYCTRTGTARLVVSTSGKFESVGRQDQSGGHLDVWSIFKVT